MVRAVSGPEQGFRNKAKMVVSGSVKNHCSVCCIETAHQKTFVTAALSCLICARFCGAKTVYRPTGLTPYNVARKRGELKYILLPKARAMAV